MAIVHRNSTGWVVEEGEKWNGLTLRYSTYTLTLNPNGGTYKSKTTAYKIPNSSQPAEPTYGKNYYWRVDAATRTGYIFKGWYDAKSGGKQVYDANGEAVKGDYWKGSGQTATWAYDDNVTLYAQWAKAYTVRFYPNGSGSTLSGSIFGASDGQSKTATVTFGLKSDINNVVGIAKRPGYTFMGWYTQRDAGGLVFDVNGKCRKGGAFWNSSGCWIKESNVSLYAHWTKVSASAPISEVFSVSSPTSAEGETVDGIAYLPDGESFPVEVRVDADGFVVVELEDAVFCGYVADGIGELFSGDRTLYLTLSP